LTANSGVLGMSYVKFFRLAIVLLIVVTLPDCKIIQDAGEGGNIVSNSGDRHCTGGHICEINVARGKEFSDAFTAVPSPGFRFAGWEKKRGGNRLCGGSMKPCALENIPGKYTDTDAEFNLVARFEPIETLPEGACTGMELPDTAEPLPFANYDTPGYYYRDLKYGSHERQTLDLFVPASETPVGVVLYFPGGGFTGNKSEYYRDGYSAQKRTLDQGFAWAFTDYPIFSNTELYVLESYTSAARAVQFLRCHAKQLNLDVNRFAATGGSAGAGVSLWLGTHDDLADAVAEDPVARFSTRLRAVAGSFTQATMDMARWEEVLEPGLLAFVESGQIPGTALEDWAGAQDWANIEFVYNLYGISSLTELYTGDMPAYRQTLDVLGLMDASDSPFCMLNIQEIGSVDISDFSSWDLIHDALHPYALKQRANEVGLESFVLAHGHFVQYNDVPYVNCDDFIARHLQ
jgi:BD-FAE